MLMQKPPWTSPAGFMWPVRAQRRVWAQGAARAGFLAASRCGSSRRNEGAGGACGHLVNHLTAAAGVGKRLVCPADS